MRRPNAYEIFMRKEMEDIKKKFPELDDKFVTQMAIDGWHVKNQILKEITLQFVSESSLTKRVKI